VLLLALLALAISLTTRVIGALPTFAFSVLPALVAIRIARNVPQALLLATTVGAIAGFSGYVVAFVYELPVGAAQTLVAATFVALTELSVRGLHMFPRRGR
jgi:zinc transport system permease protein